MGPIGSYGSIGSYLYWYKVCMVAISSRRSSISFLSLLLRRSSSDLRPISSSYSNWSLKASHCRSSMRTSLGPGKWPRQISSWSRGINLPPRYAESNKSNECKDNSFPENSKINNFQPMEKWLLLDCNTRSLLYVDGRNFSLKTNLEIPTAFDLENKEAIMVKWDL